MIGPINPALMSFPSSTCEWYSQNAVLYSQGFATHRAPGFDQVHPEHTAWYRLLHRRLTDGFAPGTIFRPS